MKRKILLTFGAIIIVLIIILVTVIIRPLMRADETLNPAYCEQISGPLSTSRRIDCYSNLGTKLGDPSLCHKISIDLPVYQEQRLYCEAVASRDINKCSSIQGYMKYFCIATLTKDTSYCDNIPQARSGCKISV